MASQNLGQVAGLWIGKSAPTNTTLIWYDNTPAIRCHKVYSVTTSAWVVLDQNTISSITYSELKNLAKDTGLTQGSWYKITDQGNILALAITTTKVQYTDVNNNFIIDDLAVSSTYVVNSDNLLVDDISGVWDVTNKKLKFSFDETAHDGNSDNDYLFGKKQRNSVWSLAKYKLSALVSAVTGNSLSWNKGIFFNFNTALSNKTDVSGGVVGKSTYDSDKELMQQSIDNISESNKAILNNAKAYTDTKTAASEVYEKVLPNVPKVGTAIDIEKGDTLLAIINKIHSWIAQFKVATGIKVSQSFAPATLKAAINNNDTVDSALRKIQYWYNHINEISLSSTWTPAKVTSTIADVAAGDTFQDAFAKIQGKLNQLGVISYGVLESMMVVESKPRVVFNLLGATLTLRYTSSKYLNINPSSGVNFYFNSKVSRLDSGGIYSNACGEVLSENWEIKHAASIVGLGEGDMVKGEEKSTDDTVIHSFIAGVAGRATNSNSNPCETYGGYFIKAKIHGLYLNCIRVTTSVTLTNENDFITCHNAANIMVVLPSDPYCGKIIKIVQVTTNAVNIVANSVIIYSSTVQNPVNAVPVGGRGKMATLIYDGEYWYISASDMS